MRHSQMIPFLLLLACGDKSLDDPKPDGSADTGPTADHPDPDAPNGETTGPGPEALPAGLHPPDHHRDHVVALANGDTAEQALQALVSERQGAVPTLRDVALHHTDLTARGWAIQGLSRIDHADADTALEGIVAYGMAPELVRTWAAAGRIARATDLDAVLALAPLSKQYPALKRPLRQQIEAHAGELGDLRAALDAMVSDTTLQELLAPVVMAGGIEPLIEQMLTHPADPARRLAAGFVGTMAGKDEGAIGTIAQAYAFDPEAKRVPWKGGALYVPGIQWDRAEARAVMEDLIAWHVFCDRKGLAQEQQQIFNNLRSVGLFRRAGYPTVRNDSVFLVQQYGQVAGVDKALVMLKDQGALSDPRYAAALSNKGAR